MRPRPCMLLLLILVLVALEPLVPALGTDAPQSFSTGGHTVYHLQMARTAPGLARDLVAATYDGSVLCYATTGQRKWQQPVTRGMPFDLCAADLDGDGRDEVLLASGDGSLSVFEANGRPRWKFQREAPLLQVCVARDHAGNVTVLTGGIDRHLYALSADGTVRGQLELPYPVRHIRLGNFREPGEELALVITMKNDKSRSDLQLYRPATLEPVWPEPILLTKRNPTEGTKFYVPWAGNSVAPASVLPIDVDGDGRDEIAFSDYSEKKGAFHVFDGKGQKRFTSADESPRGGPYRMNLLTALTQPDGAEPRILGLYGHRLLLYRTDGSLVREVEGRYSMACSAYDAETDRLFIGSSVSGGDGIYAFSPSGEDWMSAFAELEVVGRLKDVERNMATLARQVEAFQRPTYQGPVHETTIITGRSAEEIDELYRNRHDYAHVRFVQFNLLTEDYDRDRLAAPWDTKRETRHRYDMSAEEIIAFAREREARGEPFALWAGHGNDPFYMQLSTLEGVLRAAPTTARALVFPEMERTDEAMQYAVRTHLVPLAQMCREHGRARILLRNKNIFWNASCYLDFWEDVLLQGEYNDIFVPSMEETNGRTQAISLSGRMGLWLCGYFDHVSARAVTDNANYSRFWEWAGQRNLSHLMRSLALGASLGADVLHVNIFQGDAADLGPLYRMLDAGVLVPPAREDLLSVADVCLGMRSPAQEFLEHGKNGHAMYAYAPRETAMVFDRMDCYWGGAPTEESDFSNYAMGSRRRMLNFLPTNPYGLIASVPADVDLGASRFRRMLETDGAWFYDEAGNRVSAADYKSQALAALEASAQRLPVRVEGDVAWAVARIDENHVRVTLIDAGYISPADRQAIIHLQHLDAAACRDTLSGEDLPIEESRVTLTVPAGILRVIDVAHR